VEWFEDRSDRVTFRILDDSTGEIIRNSLEFVWVMSVFRKTHCSVRMLHNVYLGIYIAPLQGNYSEALPAQARAKGKEFRRPQKRPDRYLFIVSSLVICN